MNAFLLSESQANKLKSIELEILKSFIDICETMGLRWFAVQGTLLGAVRHRGFIPWDDDIDVGMLREDYERFIAVTQRQLPEHLFLQTHETDPEFCQPFAKIRDSRTTFVETASKNLDMNHGIYIDIFPFDWYPDNGILAAIYELKKLLVRYRIREIYYLPADSNKTLANLARRLLKLAAKARYATIEDAINDQERLFKSIMSGRCLINNGSPWGKRECMDASIVLGDTEVEFEGLKLRAPGDPDAYLRHVYGNYLELPPVEERVSHHYAEIIDVAVPYKESLAKLRSAS